MKLEDFIEKIEEINKDISEIQYSEKNFYINEVNYKYNEVVNSLTKIISEDSFREKNILEQFINSNSRDIDNLYYKSLLIVDEDKIKFEKILDNFLEEVERLKYFRIFSESNTIIVGANGSGKSSLVAHFKKSDADGIIVIPAQKILFFYKIRILVFQMKKILRKYKKKILMIKIMKKTI